MKLSYWLHEMMGPEAMHALGGEGKRVTTQVSGSSYGGPRGKVIRDYETMVNGRFVDDYSECPGFACVIAVWN